MLMGTPESTLSGAHALIACTEWRHFKARDFDLIHQGLKPGDLRRPQPVRR